MRLRIWFAGTFLFMMLAASCFSSVRHLAFLAALMPLETKAPEELKTAYAGTLKILVVTGHDNIDYGTEYNEIREADMTREVAGHLKEFLEHDRHFQVFITRDPEGGEYRPVFESYFKNQESEILSFRIRLHEMMIQTVRGGFFKKRGEVFHTKARDRVAQKLYGINQWANENDIDLILHIHFNDHAGRRSGRTGDYAGFTIYVPDEQFSSSRGSIDLAKILMGQLQNFLAVSTLVGESRGITEDQELIAVGALGSLDPAALLVEYGYIYEPQFVYRGFREAMMRELAYQTYRGIKMYFEPDALLSKTTLLPFRWEDTLTEGVPRSRAVLSLQVALREEGLYPPPGKNLGECPITGNFGKCTKTAIALFQEKYADEVLKPYGLSRGTGNAGPATLKKLQELAVSRL
jgi:N-acetylmuramoyl-L-alanine amidase